MNETAIANPPQDSGSAPKDAGNSAPVKEESSTRKFLNTFNPGYIVAGISGLVSTWLSIDQSFIKKLEKNKRLDKFDELRVEGYKRHYDKTWNVKEVLEDGKTWEDKIIEASNKLGENPGALEDLRTKFINVNNTKDGIFNSWDKYRRLSHGEKLQKGFTFATIVSIAAGALHSYASEHRLSEKLHHQIAQNQQSQQRQG